MPNIEPITLQDVNAAYDTYTPHIFTFRSFSNDRSGVRFKAPGGLSGQGNPTLTITRRENGSATRVGATFAIPVEVDRGTNGVVAPEVIRTLRAKVELTIPESSTEDERRHLLQKVVDLLNNSSTALAVTDSPFGAMVIGLEGLS